MTKNEEESFKIDHISSFETILIKQEPQLIETNNIFIKLETEHVTVLEEKPIFLVENTAADNENDEFKVDMDEYKYVIDNSKLNSIKNECESFINDFNDDKKNIEHIETTELLLCPTEDFNIKLEPLEEASIGITNYQDINEETFYDCNADETYVNREVNSVEIQSSNYENCTNSSTETNATQFSCDQCTFKTIYKSNLNTHVKSHGEDHKKFPCTFCNKTYTRKIDLDDHLIRRHKQEISTNEIVITSKILKCTKCSYQTAKLYDLKRHNMVKHPQIIAGSQKFTCNYCVYSTELKTNFNKHLSHHHNDKVFACIICSRSFSNKPQRDVHIAKNHSDNQNLMATITRRFFECQQCSYKSLSNVDLTNHNVIKHKIITTDLEKFKCDICDYTTYIKTYFNRHLLTHSSSKPFACTICNASFTRKRSIDAHILKQHSDSETLMSTITTQILECQHCPYTSFNRVHFKKHLTKH